MSLISGSSNSQGHMQYTDEENDDEKHGGKPFKIQEMVIEEEEDQTDERLSFERTRRKEYLVVMGSTLLLFLATITVFAVRNHSPLDAAHIVPITFGLSHSFLGQATSIASAASAPPTASSSSSASPSKTVTHIQGAVTLHPIDTLITEANEAFSSLSSQPITSDPPAAATEYRKRRGRHPPPGFDKWFEFAQQSDALTSEWLFDQIYEDLEPFWGTPAAKTRADAASWPVVLSIRDGETKRRRAMPPVWASRDLTWENMINQIPAGLLPDVDLPLNLDDNGHIFVPWEDMKEYMEAASETRKLSPPEEMSSEFAKYPPIENVSFQAFEDSPSETNLWLLTRDTCPPDSEARNLVQDEDFTVPAHFPNVSLSYMTSGYVSNWTAARSSCENTFLRNTQGYFVNYIWGSAMHWADPESNDRLMTRKLFPVFSSGKLTGSSNDILIPSATDWSTDYFSQDNSTWSDKINQVIWRGSATGGVNNDTNWTRFHRHRFISMLNATQLSMTQASPHPPAHLPGGDPILPYNFPLPNADIYNIAAQHDLGRWISTFANAAFVFLFCYPLTDYVKNNNGTTCPYDSHFYHSEDIVPMEDFFKAKYLPDLDGHGYSGRYRALIQSASLPIKATIWQEWSTLRLHAWTHFVPMDGTFVDWWGLMDYFLGYKPAEESKEIARQGHDEAAEMIATQGREWAERVLRKEDMIVYTWRLILEFARICDDNRERLGWVEDLL